MLGIKNSCKLKLGQVCNSQQESNLTWGWRFTYLLYHMNYSLLVQCCCYLDRQEKRFSLLPCAKNTKLYTEFMGSEKNGNSLNEMKILVVFLEMFRQNKWPFFCWYRSNAYHTKNTSFAIWQPLCHRNLLLSTWQTCKILQKSMMWYIFNAQFHFTCM